jgi:hypothetical protein
LTVPAMNLFRVLPNFYRWWNPDLKESAGPIYSYPRYATRALAELLVLSTATQALACRGKPPTAAILVITNANDRDVNNELTTRVIQCWRKQGVKDLRTFEFEPNLKLIHDFIDPGQEDQQIEIVYPRLIELITK